MTSALLILASAMAALPVSIGELRAYPDRYDGRRVRIEGWVNGCGLRDCHISENLSSRRNKVGAHLSFEGIDAFDRQLKPLLPARIQVEATFSAWCLTGPVICLDRSPELRAPVVRKIFSRNQKFPEE